MNKKDVLELIKELNEKQTETMTIECKSANKGNPKKIYDTISSFSNTIGGTILFGVEQKEENNITKFEVGGVYNVDLLQKYIVDICTESMEPVIRPEEISVIDIDGKKVIAVRIEPINPKYKPCYYKSVGLHKGSYIRVGDKDDNMTEYEIYKCISYREDEEDDLRAVVKATIDDLDKDLLEDFIAKYTADKPNFSKYSKEDILLKAGVLTKIEDKIFPTVAGLMVFGEYPQQFFPQWFIAAMVVPGYEIGGLGKVGERFIDNERIEGNIAEMYEKAIRFLKRNMKVGMRLNKDTGLREDLPEYPIDRTS